MKKDIFTEEPCLAEKLATLFESVAVILRSRVIRSIRDDQLMAITRQIALDALSLTEELTIQQVQERLGVSRATCDRWIAKGKLPKGRKRKGDSRLYWYRDEVDKVIAQRK